RPPCLVPVAQRAPGGDRTPEAAPALLAPSAPSATTARPVTPPPTPSFPPVPCPGPGRTADPPDPALGVTGSDRWCGNCTPSAAPTLASGLQASELTAATGSGRCVGCEEGGRGPDMARRARRRTAPGVP